MKHSWTMKELKDTEMDVFVKACLYDRQSDLNPYSPLRLHINKAVKWVELNKELIGALRGLQKSFQHTEGNVKGNKAKTNIIRYNDDVKEALRKTTQVLVYKLEVM